MGATSSCAVCCHDVAKKGPVHLVGEESLAPPPAPVRRPGHDECAPLRETSKVSAFSAPPPPGCCAPQEQHGEEQVEGAASTVVPSEADDVSVADGGSLAGTESSVGVCSAIVADVGQAQHLVKSFVRSYVKGRVMTVLAVNGSLTECILTLDRKLSSVTLARGGKNDSKKRQVPLEDIAEIVVGKEASQEVDLPVDELCVVLILEQGSAVGFRFDNIEERDVFALCMSMFVDGRKGEMKRRRKEAQSGSPSKKVNRV